MKKTFTIVLLVLFCICGYAQMIDPVLLEQMGQRRDNEKIRVFVIMRQQYDQQQLNRRAAHFTTRADRREFVVNELKQFAEASQYDLRHTLADLRRVDLVSEPKVLWIANSIFFEATRDAILSLADRSDIMVIGFDEERKWLPDGEESQPADPTREIASNVTQVHADQVWNMGYTGQGVVVAVIDSGVNYNHLDLTDHLWDGGTEFPHHGYDVYNNDNDPMDDHGHGTHCAGTVCGDGTAGSQTGMAPDATLMCVKCLSSEGSCYDTDVINGMQWAVAHGCDVISMSLGGNGHSGAEKTILRNTCVNVLSAGVIASIAAGNEGDRMGLYPIPKNVGLPGGCPPPYLDPEQALNPGGLSCSVCVGAVDMNDQAAYFTSHGPCDWSDSDYADYPYTPGSLTEFGLIRPDVCAPGVSVKSADYRSNNGYSVKSGTSMATPCVAGCMALMLSKDIYATPADVCRILEETAASLATGKSNIYGYGRVDALAAINAMRFCPLTLDSFTVNDEQGNNDGKLNAGESVTLNLTLTNDSDIALDGATIAISIESEYITITNGTANLPHFGAGQTRTINNMFSFTLNEDAPAKMVIQFKAETFVNGESIGSFMIGVMVYGHLLKFAEVSVLNDNNGNGLLDAGETANLHVTIINLGNEPALSIVGALSTAYPYLVINSNNKSFGSIEVNEQASADFNVRLMGGAPVSYTICLSLDLADANQKHTDVEFEYWKKAITLTSYPAGAGTLSGGSYYGPGQSCTITASANPGYAFVRWTLNNETVSYFPTYTFVATDEAEYVACFQALPNSVVIGDGDGKNENLPVRFHFNYYSLSQQIYTADELNLGACEISSVSFFTMDDLTGLGDMAIYMVNTSKTAFDSNTDWIAVTEADRVFNGSAFFIYDTWTTIYFDTPFAYDGSSNIALIVDDNSASAGLNAPSSRVYSTDSNQALYVYGGFEPNFDPYNPEYSGTLLMEKNHVCFGIVSYDYTVTTSANPTDGGTVSDGGICYYHQPFTLTATPNEGYVFNNWTKNGAKVSHVSPDQINVTETAEYVANFQQVDGIVIGEASLSNSYLPSYSYYSLSEQIYTADELNLEACEISSVSFYNPSSSKTLNWNVYMANTNKTAFDSNTDWIPVSETDLVFSGSVTLTGYGWATIYFNTPFAYDGSSNVVLVVDDNSNSYSYSCRAFGTEGSQAIRIYGSGMDYDPSSPSGYTGILMTMKNQVIFGIPSYDYTVTVSANPSNGGTVSGGGLCFLNQPITLTATPNEGYIFTNWTKDGTVVSYLSHYNLSVTESANYVANFELEPDGIVIGDGAYANANLPTYRYYSLTEQIYTSAEMGGSPCQISSVSFFNTGVSNRTRNMNIYMVGTDKTSFEDTSDWIPVSESNLVFSGNVTFTANNWVTVYFSTPFIFDGSSNVALVVDDNSNSYNTYISCRTFGTDTNQAIFINGSGTNYDPYHPTNYTGTLVLVKNQVIFGLPSYDYIVTATANPEEGGTVSGGEGYYYMGQSCTLTATANDGYYFYYWTKDGIVVSSDATYTFQVMGNMNLVANFGPPLSISVISNPEEGGVVSGGGEYGYNQPCTLTATPNEGYVFNYWTKNGSVVSGISPATVTITAEAEYVANFQSMDGIVIGDAAHANANLPSCFDYPYSMTQQIYTADEINSDACEISSVSFFNTGYYSTRNLTIYMVNTNKTAFANSRDWITVSEANMVYSGNVEFEEMYSWITIYFDTPFLYNGSSNVALVVNDETGDWWGSSTCRTFDTQATQAIYVNDGYYYTPINPYNPSSYNGTLMSEKNQVIFGMPIYEYMVTLTAEPEEGGIVNGGGGPYYYGQHIPMSATASPGYVFNNWTKYDEYYEYNEVVSFFSNDKIPVTETADYVANFQQMDGIVIGDAVHTNAYLPNCSDYSYSMTQQIYTADEINSEECEIFSVSFFNTGYYDTRDLTIYMVNTDKTAFASESDWITVTEADKVYSGSVVFEATYYWTTIYFDTPFYYDGSSNVALIVNDETGDWWGSSTCRTFDAHASQAIYVHDDFDYTPIDPYNPSEYYGTLMWEKNQVVFGVAVYQYMVTVSADPEEGGAVSGGGGPYYYGQQIPVSATANPSYVFNNWTKVDEEGWYYEVVSCFSTDNIPVTETCGLVANFQQTDGIIIGDAVQTNAYLPSCFDYSYSMTQQIYTADEINSGACELSSVSFFNTGYYSSTRNLTIYMVNTDKTSFASSTDWITVTEADMVFSGNVTMEDASWTTIYFNTTFNYDGSSNVALIVNDVTGDYGWGNTTCRTFDTPDPQAIYVYDYQYNYTPYNPYNPSGYYGTLMWEKNHVIFGIAVYQYMVTLSADPEEGGMVSGGGGPYYYGQSVQISATTNAGYVFDKWAKNGNGVSYFTTDTIAVTETAEYVASFDQFDGIIIGDAIKTNSYLPAYYYYSLSQQIYTAEEMDVDEACEISSVSFYNTGSNLTRMFTIYMVNTEKNSFESSSDWITVTEADQVFSGSVTMSAGGWATIYFDTPFAYDGMSNVALVVDNDSKSWGGSTFRVIDSEPNQTIRVSSYNTNYDPCNPVGFTGTRVSLKNQVLFGIPSYDYTVTATANTEDGGTVTGGESLYYYGQPVTLTATANEGYVFNNWTKDGTVVSYFSTYSLSVTESAEYVANFQKIDNGFAVGDATNTNAYLPTYSYYPYTLSQQIYTVDEMGGEATQISSISFFNTGSNRTRNMSIYMVHTNKTAFDNNSDWITVTEADRVFSGSVTMAASDWTDITFDVPFLYNGTSNVVLVVDDNTNSWYSGISCRTFNTEGNQALRICGYGTDYDPYNPSAYNGMRYSVKNQIIFGVTFPTVVQTITLTQGWNWFSLFLEGNPVDLLEMLEAELGDNGIQIKSPVKVTAWDEDEEEWSGGLQSIGLTNDKTYMVEVQLPANTTMTVSLEGPASTPGGYAIEINPGWNWIGFPSAVSIDINDAFSDFDAVAGDQIKTKDKASAWDEDEEEWSGGLNTLVPGQGYMYYSNSTQPKILIFSTTAKGKSVFLLKHKE